MKRIIFILAVATLTGCATTPTAVSTPSGRPEVFISGVTPEQVKPVIIDRELSKGWQLAEDTAYQVSFTKPSNNIGDIASLGSQFNGIPNARIKFTITDAQGGTQVFLNGEMVSNPGSGFEKTYPAEDVNRNVFPQMQKVLEEIKTDVLNGHASKSKQ